MYAFVAWGILQGATESAQGNRKPIAGVVMRGFEIRDFRGQKAEKNHHPNRRVVDTDNDRVETSSSKHKQK